MMRFLIAVLALCGSVDPFRRRDYMELCPLVTSTNGHSFTRLTDVVAHSQVKPMRNFQLDKMMGFWHVVQYYSSTEETAEYKCMRGELEITTAKEVS